MTEREEPREGQEVLGRRIGAALIDFIPIGVIFFLVALITGNVETNNGVQANLNGGPALLFFALALGYYYLFESTSGQTLGKKALGVRVVHATGQPASNGQIAGRTAMRIIDILPFLYLIGFIAILATGKRAQRLGDMAASTHVVAAQGSPPSP